MARAASFSSAITSCRCNSGLGCSWRQVSMQNCLRVSKDSCDTMAGANARPMVTSAANLFISASLHSDPEGVEGYPSSIEPLKLQPTSGSQALCANENEVGVRSVV